MQRTPRTDAIFDLLQEGKRTRTTQAGINKTIRACARLGFTQAETIVVLRYMDVVNRDGAPYAEGITLTFPKTMGA